METTVEKARRRRRKAATPAQAAPVEAPAPAQVAGTLQDRLNAAMGQLTGFFTDREDAVRCMVVALITGMNYLLIGPRGTAKTALANCLMMHVEGSRHFSTLLGSFSTINDLVGRIDLAALQRGEEKRKIEGRLLDCDTAFLDEALKGSDGVLNSLLGLLSDNRDFEGAGQDLWSVGSATNWPEVNRRTDRIAALYDRFHLKVPVNPVQTREHRVAVLRASRKLRDYRPQDGTTITVDELRQVAEDVSKVALPPEIEELMCSVQERCTKEQIDISDRKMGQWQRALQACAWLDARDTVGVEDFLIITYMAWDNAKDIDKAKAIVESCDRELVQGLIRRVDQARDAYKQANQSGMNAEKASKVLDQIINTAEYVNEAMRRYQLKPESKKDVGRAVTAMQKDFETLFERFGEALEEGEG